MIDFSPQYEDEAAADVLATAPEAIEWSEEERLWYHWLQEEDALQLEARQREVAA